MPRRLPRKLFVVLAIGVVLLVVGMALFARAGLSPDGIGWFAYSPLSEMQDVQTEAGRLVVIRPGNWWGTALALTGAVTVAGALGYALGSRHRRALGDN